MIGSEMFTRCPKAWLHDAQAYVAIMRDVFWAERFGTLPNAGGILDQDPLFLAAVQIVDATRKMLEDRKRALEHGKKK